MGIFSRHDNVGKRVFNAWQIEITTRCPLACRMCVKEAHPDWLRKDMALSDFERIVPHLKMVKSVILEGWGESLMHKRLNDFISLAKSGGAEVGFVTSGFGLSEDRTRELIDLGIDFIGFSLSGCSAATHNGIRIHSDFYALCNSMKTFMGLARSGRRKRPKVHIVYLALKENMTELPQVVDMAHGLGIEEVVVITNAQVTTPWQDEQKIFSCGDGNPYRTAMDEARRRAQRLKVKLGLPGLNPSDVAVCSENPLENVYISVEGDVAPCVYLQPPVPSPFRRIYCGETSWTEKVSFGNIFREEWSAIWDKPEYAGFRSGFVERQRCRLDSLAAFMEMRAARVHPLPVPPQPCQTCHKMLGF